MMMMMMMVMVMVMVMMVLVMLMARMLSVLIFECTGPKSTPCLSLALSTSRGASSA